jgi:hypothetical protein
MGRRSGGLIAVVGPGESFAWHLDRFTRRLGRASTIAGTHGPMTGWPPLVGSAAGTLDLTVADADRRRPSTCRSVAAVGRVGRPA